MRNKRIYISVIVSLWCITCSLAQSNGTINIAVIADKAFDLDQSHLVSILEVELSQTEGIQVLERTQIDKILQEQQLNLAGLLDRNAIVKAGQILRADAFVLLSQESSNSEAEPTRQRPVDEFDEDLPQQDNSPKGKLIRVRIVETAHGLRLSDRFEELDDSKLKEVTERIIKEITAVIGKLNLPAGQAIPIGIVDIHRVQLGERHKLLERALPVLLSVRLSKEPKIIMLEREDLKVLLEEKFLTEGKDSDFWTSAVLIDGYLQPKEGSLEMVLQLRQAAGHEIVAFTVPVEPNGPSLAIEEAAPKIIKQLQNSPLSTQWQPELEAEEFYKQGQLLHKHQRHEDAFKLFETAHALQPRNVFYTGELCVNEWSRRRNFGDHQNAGIIIYSDLELAELASIFVRQIRDGYDKGELSAYDIRTRWSRFLGTSLSAFSSLYFSSTESVATEQIRLINRENRRILIETMDKALKQYSLQVIDPRMNIQILRARLAWFSSDDPNELIVNFKKAFTEFVMPPEMGGTIESDEQRDYIYDRAFLSELKGPPNYLERTHLKNVSGRFLKLLQEYLEDLSEVEDFVVRTDSLIFLSKYFKDEGGSPKLYYNKALDELRKELQRSNQSLSNSEAQIIVRLLKDTPIAVVQVIETKEMVEIWEEFCGYLIERTDVHTLTLLNSGSIPFFMKSTQLKSDEILRYYMLLERTSYVLKTHKDDTQVAIALNKIKDLQAEIKRQFPQLDTPQEPSNLTVTMLLARKDWPKKVSFFEDKMRVKIQNEMLWTAFLGRGIHIYRYDVALAGIDLKEKKSKAIWQADISFTHSLSSTIPPPSVVIDRQAIYVSAKYVGLVEFPGSLEEGREYFRDPNDLKESGLQPELIERYMNKEKQEQESYRKLRIFKQQDNLPSRLITSIVQDSDKLWIAYGDIDQESGLGLYDPKTQEWETVFCSTLKGEPPFNSGRPYRINSMELLAPDKLFFCVLGIEHTGLWRMDKKTQKTHYMKSAQGEVNADLESNIWFKSPSQWYKIDPDSENMTKIIPNSSRGLKRESQQSFADDIFLSESFVNHVRLGPCRLGYLDLSTGVIYNNRLWARLGKSQIIIVGKGKSFEEARIIDNDILDGEPVERFLSTPYGLVAIGNGIVGLIDTE